MTRTNFWSIAAWLVCAGGALAQTLQTGDVLYQQGAVLSTTRAIGPGIFNPESVTGSPFSGTEQSHSLQVLGDGTRIERTESRRIYRDSQGRTRTETGTAGSRIIMIQDPVAGTVVTLNESSKTAEKSPTPRIQIAKAGPQLATARVQLETHVTSEGQGGRQTVVFATGPGMPGSAAVLGSTKPDTEELPIQNVNGVLASGKKTTLTIGAGEIGNDRPIRVVGETWYSNDLQMMVKSSNTDPRFGDTTFELTNINRVEPDPSLFQVPAEYTTVSPKTFFNSAVPPPPPPPPPLP
jgi:hypothetical protein